MGREIRPEAVKALVERCADKIELYCASKDDAATVAVALMVELNKRIESSRGGE